MALCAWRRMRVAGAAAVAQRRAMVGGMRSNSGCMSTLSSPLVARRSVVSAPLAAPVSSSAPFQRQLWRRTAMHQSVRSMALWGSKASTEESSSSSSDAQNSGSGDNDAAYTVVDAVEPEMVVDDAFAGAGGDGRALTAWFTKRNIAGSTKKLNVLARQIRGLSVNDAIAQMAFSPKNRGRVARHVIERAVANADFYHGWSRDELCIAEAFVGKNAQYPRVRYHSRGRAGRAHLRYSQMTVHVRKMTDEELAAVAKKQERWAAFDASRTPDLRQY